MEDLKQKIEDATTNLEAKVDTIWTRIGDSKWTWSFALAVIVVVLSVIF